MELLFYVAIFLAGFLVAIFLSKLFYTSRINYLRNEGKRLIAEKFRAHYYYLGLLRSEYANAILEPKTLLQADKDAEEYEKKVKLMTPDEFKTEVSEFWEHYPDISSFDSIYIKCSGWKLWREDRVRSEDLHNSMTKNADRIIRAIVFVGVVLLIALGAVIGFMN